MDLRIERTRKNIINAFLQLRRKKPLEKITVKELAEAAYINKATFYTHYKDIYDLTDQLENESIQAVLKKLTHPEYIVSNPSRGFRELTEAFVSEEALFNTLFSGTRAYFFAPKLEIAIKEHIYTLFPEYKNNLERNLLISVLTQGCFHTYLAHKNDDRELVVKVIANINECLIQNYKSVTQQENC